VGLTGRRIALAAGGLAVGALFLWLALSRVDAATLTAQLAALDGGTLALATAFYWVAIGLRVLRWQLLLSELAPAPLPAVAETLIAGYAVNNVLPARLGEVARAAYAKRRLGIGRARVFGSIVIERLLDLGAILGLLGAGLVLHEVRAHGARVPTFELIALNAGVLVGVAVLLIALLRAGGLDKVRLPSPVVAVLVDFRAGIAVLNRRSVVLAVLLSAVVWCFEVFALAQIFRALDLAPSTGELLLLMGAASLSTLVPTAPGYLGTYQLVFVLAMRAFGLPEAAGVVAASAIQLCLFGSVTLAGGALLALRASVRLRRSADVRDGEVVPDR
jgi:uncharacterized protein (TIRG00374 family)